MKKCKLCGAKMDDDALFCTVCGAKLDEMSSIEIFKCPICGTELDDDALFCTVCGAKIEKKENTVIVKEGKKCSFCGADIEEDVMFCTKCGTKIDGDRHSDNVVYEPPCDSKQNNTSVTVRAENESKCLENIPSETSNANVPTEDMESDFSKEKHNHKFVISVIIIGVLSLCAVGVFWYYKNVYIPEKIDREAPRYYTMANTVVLRSSKYSGADYNKIGSLPYGTELITYEHGPQWSKVKINSINEGENKREGYIASPYILNKADFFLLNSIFGDMNSRDCIGTVKCRQAILNYYKKNQYIGRIDEQTRKEAGITICPNYSNQWQIFCKPQNVKPNNVFFKRLHDPNSRFTDFAVIITNINQNRRKLLYFYFGEDETPHFWFEMAAPMSGNIKDIVIEGGIPQVMFTE